MRVGTLEMKSSLIFRSDARGYSIVMLEIYSPCNDKIQLQLVIPKYGANQHQDCCSQNYIDAWPVPELSNS